MATTSVISSTDYSLDEEHGGNLGWRLGLVCNVFDEHGQDLSVYLRGEECP